MCVLCVRALAWRLTPRRSPLSTARLPPALQLCYYQALEFAIERGLQRVEAGAQGEHKLQRVRRQPAAGLALLQRQPGAEPGAGPLGVPAAAGQLCCSCAATQPCPFCSRLERAQGYMPSLTYSLHYLPNRGFAGAVDRCGAAASVAGLPLVLGCCQSHPCTAGLLLGACLACAFGRQRPCLTCPWPAGTCSRSGRRSTTRWACCGRRPRPTGSPERGRACRLVQRLLEAALALVFPPEQQPSQTLRRQACCLLRMPARSACAPHASRTLNPPSRLQPRRRPAAAPLLRPLYHTPAHCTLSYCPCACQSALLHRRCRTASFHCASQTSLDIIENHPLLPTCRPSWATAHRSVNTFSGSCGTQWPDRRNQAGSRRHASAVQRHAAESGKVLPGRASLALSASSQRFSSPVHSVKQGNAGQLWGLRPVRPPRARASCSSCPQR